MRKFKVEYFVHGVSFNFEIDSDATLSEEMRKRAGLLSKTGMTMIELEKNNQRTLVRRSAIDAIRVTEITL